jgi:hypothetical protein
MNIREFKVGDHITRVERSKGPRPDGSYLGDELILVNIENGSIYYFRHDNSLTDQIRKLYLLEWDEGWEYYKNPTNNINYILETIDIKIIESFLRKKKLEKVSKK